MLMVRPRRPSVRTTMRLLLPRWHYHNNPKPLYAKFQCKPLRQFQAWFRQEALPSQKFMHHAEDMRRALCFPWPTSASEVCIWIFPWLGYWRLTPYGRGALGCELLMPEPDWHRIVTCLRLSVRGPLAGMSTQRRRGNAVRGPRAVTIQQ